MLPFSDAYSEPSQIFKMELFAETLTAEGI